MTNTQEIAVRLKSLREDMEISPEEMATVAHMDVDTYLEFETGKKDFSVTMLYNCAERFGVNVTTLLTGFTPKLSSYSIVKAGQGVKTERRHSFTYEHLAWNFKDRQADPFYVVAPFEEGAEDKPIALSSHKGEEMDYILEGQLLFTINGKTEVLNPGDTVFYNSSQPHGMIAIGGKPCKFLAILVKSHDAE